ncbi:MAG: hypothetical protein GTO63_33835, partial [Anaerolineae bacterium]|nr:hypothetical protein [Anaerolineae bacterium]
PATAPNVYFETNIDLLGVSWDSVELVTDVSGKPLGKVGGAVGFVIAVVEVGYYTHLFFQSNYRIEQFYYSYKALAAALDFFITLIPIVGPVLQLVTFGTTYVLWRLGLVDEPSTIGDLIMEAIVGSDLSEELEECHDAVGRLEDVSEWLEATFEQHKELGDFFIFAGGVSLAGEVEELCNSV